jgi:hypothetical protein
VLSIHLSSLAIALFVNICYWVEMPKLNFYDGTDTAYDGTDLAYDGKNFAASWAS